MPQDEFHNQENIPEQEPKKPNKSDHKSRAAKLTMHTVSIVINIILLLVVNSLQNWNIKFITSDWPQVLGILNFSLILSIVMYAAFLFYDEYRFYFLGRLAMDAVGIAVIYRLLAVFPVNFAAVNIEWLDIVIKIGLIIGIIGTVIGMIVRTIKLMLRKNIYY